MKTNGKTESVSGPLLPELKFYDVDYATLCHRLDVYDDQVIYTRYRQAQPEATFPVDPADLASVLGGFPISAGVLPKSCLFWSRTGGETRLAVYVEPQVWRVHVKGEKKPWRVPQPGLVMAGRGTKYGLYAVKSYPDAGAMMYKAPCPNVRGNVCTGNVNFPAAEAGTIWQAVDLFFSSGFNADLAGGKSVKHSANILELWRELNEAGAEEYPLDDLVSEGFTLQKLAEGS